MLYFFSFDTPRFRTPRFAKLAKRSGLCVLDIENCPLPAKFTNASKVSKYITAAVQSVGIRARTPIQIKAYGDLFHPNQTDLHDLYSSGINLLQISADRNSGAYKYIRSSIRYWAEQNPPPAHLLLISSDRDFAQTLHRLRLDNYNVMLASRESRKNPVHPSLMSAATVMWDWNCLLRDEIVVGRYFFAQPPSSLYGQYDGPLHNPFSVKKTYVSAQVNVDVPKAFCREDFWIDFQKFLNTELGSLIVTESISCENLCYFLQKYGPKKYFTFPLESDVIRLIDVLIAKEWLIESPHHSYPFKLHQQVTYPM